MEQIWFTADEHFGHANIIKFCHRPFENMTEMQEKLIANHNSIVKKGDRIYHIGDMFWRTLTDDQALNIRYRLNGQHFYLYGNHDEVFHRSEAVRKSFIWCKDVFNLKIFGQPDIWLSHYAHRVWNGSHKGAWHLYGHSHAGLSEVTKGNMIEGESPYAFDVGVDAWNYFPVNIDQIAEKMKKKGWQYGTRN